MTIPTLSPSARDTAPGPHAAETATEGAFFSLFLDHPQPMWIYELGTLRFMAVNPAAQRTYGYSAEEFSGMTLGDLLPPSQQARFFAFLDQAPAPGDSGSALWSHRCKDGELIDVQVTAHALEFRGRRCRFVFANDVSAMLRVERALYKSEQLQRRLIDTLPHQIFWKHPDHSYAGCNVVFARAAGLDHPDQVVGKRDQDFPWAHNADRIRTEDSAIMATGVPMLEFEDQLMERDGRLHDYVITKLPLYDQEGAIIGVLGTIEDVTARKLAQKTLRLQSSAVESSVNAIVITSARDGRHLVDYVNPAFTRVTGYASADILGRDCRILQRGDTDQGALALLRAAIDEGREATVVLRSYRKDGSLFWNELRVAPVREEGGQVSHWVGVISDISATLSYQAELEHQANHDALTRLPNRNLFNDRLDQAIAFAGRYGQALWVVFIDLDNFKLVNDTLGHAMGDRLLQTVSARLSQRLRQSDTVARLGGDEFMLLLMDHQEPRLTEAVIAELLQSVSAPVRLDDHELTLTCSIGVSVYPKDGSTGAELLKHADMAMYQAKGAGRNQQKFYAAEMDEKLSERALIEKHLRHAVARGELVLHYQPRVHLHTGRVTGVEALVRWQHPELGMVPPGRFIAIAEETGIIVEIGHWVLGEACRQAVRWLAAGLPPMHMAVNVSARQFRKAGFASDVAASLAASGMAPALLELEITESMMMDNVEEAVQTLVELKRSGVKLSIDDFGTGYSSLSSLRHFPLDFLKIDQSFVRDMLSDRNGEAIVRSIIALGHSLNFEIIAEGVETAPQLEYLRASGCDEMQGYFYSRPLAAPALEALVRERNS
ncbi:EAL domain-containing protein [Massilia sp. PAMC28688]|uniref:sensor domain-containing protein n=1 Tax=Massilia sp. PAMC28688 TaxID=2861283 RepID=UPI001C624872|nr:EAL domain-containing protein [Massilia sp. PAMC28688]QYF92707.1 EAL domain-containing protein [Massilia sp. PAMC28688]